MGEPTFASLNPSLLARKGGAKPAMRPQHGLPAPQVAVQDQLEDLGWNDMGTGDDTSDNVVSLTDSSNEVHRQQQEVAERVAAIAPTRSKATALSHGKRAAFTLRLDSERHLKLRLACTVKGRSAQQIVTEALDRLLGEMPDIAALAAHVTRK